MQPLPQLKRTPVRERHPLVYGAGLLLLVALILFIGRIEMVWVLIASGVAVAMGIGAIAIALRSP
jgi:hypothetical protein